MAVAPTFPLLFKDPSADLDYALDLSPAPSYGVKPWLALGETVVSLTVTADAGITVASSSISTNAIGVAAALLVAWITGGVVGAPPYNVHFLFTTSMGRTDTRSIQIQCAQR